MLLHVHALPQYACLQPLMGVLCCRWASFTAGWFFGGLGGVGWAYACAQFLPYYS